MTEFLAYDSMQFEESARTIDDNGFLHVTGCAITKEQVAPYFGREIPNWQRLGLNPDSIYKLYRPAAEIKKAVESCNGIPIQLEHHEDLADAPAKETRIGSTGTDGEFKAPYLVNSLHFTDANAIKRIQDGSMRELSLCYRYEPVAKRGTFDGEDYDLVMTNLSCNHVALVEKGRAGHDVFVKDSVPEGLKTVGGSKDTAQNINNNAANGVNNEDNAMDSEKLKLFIDELVKAGIDGEKAKATIEEIIKERTAEPAEKVEEVQEEVKTEDEDTVDVKNEDSEVKDEDVVGVEEVTAEDQLIKDALKECGLDEEPEEVQKAFAEGVKYGEKLEKTEPQKLDSEHESEGEKKALGEDDDDLTDKIAAIVEAKVAERFKAAEEATPVLGKVNAMVFDSAGSIYRAACKKMGVAVKGMSDNECRAVYRAMSAVKVRNTTMAKDSATVDAKDPIRDKLNKVKTSF